ncbi:adenylate/guanylate cyclase domain-containing protein [Mangrovimonas aestuarii]|uniref:adenylate/guanylate cyclase domain-containing protein n=1 Tax=Mangrovimonas aestuarii TaxID=3018443 RepID=UPI0023783EF8|nr:adenylate/guanylate cyclase domain-containing protein [Mangrovimonas aestuarii]
MSEIKFPIVTYTGINEKVTMTDQEGTLLDCSIMNQIPHMHECGGNGFCTTCRVRVITGLEHLSPRTQKEQETAQLRKWDPSIRLACQSYINGDVAIQRLVWNSAEINKLQLETLLDHTADERAIAFLFCDIRGFTKIALENKTFDTAHILNRFYTVLGDPILFNNGVIYQYAGDEIIGLFGVSGGVKHKTCSDAVRAALGMQYAVERLNKFELVDFDTEIKIGIGINFGRAFIGNLGHPKYKQFAVVGDPVNTTSRIQDYNKTAGTNILISETILRSFNPSTLNIGREFEIQLQGHEHLTKIYELFGFHDMDIQLELQHSLDYLLRNEDEFAAKFYGRVFDKSNEIEALFKHNMKAQGRLLTHMLGSIVYSMSRPEYLEMGLKTLGKNHYRYGVREEYYPIVLDCLMATIKEQLGEQYTEQIGTAWYKALLSVTDEMKKYTGE